MRPIVTVLLIGVFVSILINRYSQTITIGGTCDFIGGWGRGTPKECQCIGVKITIDNSLPSDGNYHTLCAGLGLVKTH